ncbi:MAG: response regulator [SAR324 cluster bacterium]|nr:response regulator [SAR324 cluster bacterium]
MKVLLLDDNKMNNLLLERLLLKINIPATSTIRSVEALEFIEQAERDFEPFDLLFCDMIMPGNLDGFAVIKKIRQAEKLAVGKKEKSSKPLTIVALTALKSAKTEAKLQELGCNFFLSKPINKKVVEEIIAKVGAQTAA